MEEKLSRKERIKRGIIKMPKPGPRKKREPKKSGPPPQALMDDEVMLERAVAFVEAGQFPDDAWVLAGGTQRTFERYKQWAAAGQPPYQYIMDQLHAAGCRHNERLVKVAQGLAIKKNDAKVILDITGRRHKKWSPRQRFEVVGDPEAMLIWQMMGERFGADATQQFIRDWQLACAGLRGVPSEAGPGSGG